MNVRHLQAHVFYLLSHVSEHVSTLFGLVGTRASSQGVRPSPPPFPQLKYDANMCTYDIDTQMGRDGGLPMGPPYTSFPGRDNAIHPW